MNFTVGFSFPYTSLFSRTFVISSLSILVTTQQLFVRSMSSTSDRSWKFSSTRTLAFRSLIFRRGHHFWFRCIKIQTHFPRIPWLGSLRVPAFLLQSSNIACAQLQSEYLQDFWPFSKCFTDICDRLLCLKCFLLCYLCFFCFNNWCLFLCSFRLKWRSRRCKLSWFFVSSSTSVW